MIRTPPEVTAALKSLTVPYEVRLGGKHIKVLVNGRLAAVLPLGAPRERDKRSMQNTLAQIRRAAAGQFSRGAAN